MKTAWTMFAWVCAWVCAGAAAGAVASMLNSHPAILDVAGTVLSILVVMATFFYVMFGVGRALTEPKELWFDIRLWLEEHGWKPKGGRGPE